MNITFQAMPVKLKGNPIKEGDKLPEFVLTKTDLSPLNSYETKGIRVFLAVPSLDTGVCDLEVKKFNAEASKLPDVSVYAVSLDLPFAQARWCGANGANAITALSDYTERSFGIATGTFIEHICLLTRAVFVVDENDRITYVEYVPEITNHPDYDKAFAAIKNLTK